MNARHDPAPLDLPLPPESRDSRRRQVGPIELRDAAVQQFNQLLAQIAPNAPRVSADQLVTLARWLQDQPREHAVAILSERLARAEHLRRMLNDSDWDVCVDTRERARMLISYLQQVDDLIPDTQPLLGHLDDALLVELAWPAFADETLDYGDFCRFRAEARPRGTPRERRLAWETACLAEVALIQQRRQVRARHYIGGEPLPALFRVS
ncbi:YkvA family protein [Arenimonas sp.]|uniref:YkvA family protein n=1 Tax=Arenimonas sp. TaxID=1872635 RepID=UPI0025C34285|nr:YkvA family protein [Arenimonas sp.]